MALLKYILKTESLETFRNLKCNKNNIRNNNWQLISHVRENFKCSVVAHSMLTNAFSYNVMWLSFGREKGHMGTMSFYPCSFHIQRSYKVPSFFFFHFSYIHTVFFGAAIMINKLK